MSNALPHMPHYSVSQEEAVGRQYSQSIYVNELLVKIVQHVSLVIFSLVRQGGGAVKVTENMDGQAPTALNISLRPLAVHAQISDWSK